MSSACWRGCRAQTKGKPFIDDDDLVEVTSTSVWLRKKLPTENERRRESHSDLAHALFVTTTDPELLPDTVAQADAG